MPQAIEPDAALLPIAGWDLIPVREHGAIIVRLHYLSHALQSVEEAQADRVHILHTTMARDLARALLEQADRLEAAAASAPPNPGQTGPTH